MMFRARKGAALFLALLFSLLCLLPAQAESSAKKYTLMIYMCGSNLESEHGQATRDISNMLATRFNRDDINVVLLLGGCAKWSSNYSPKQLTLVELNGRRPTVVDELPQAPMSDAETLSAFLQTCWDKYPAENYILDLWDHGGGPIYGVCQDLLFKGDTLTLPELTEAFRNSPFAERKLDGILMNACLMGSAEVSIALAPYAKYLVAGEDSIYGLDYNFLAGMENEPDVASILTQVVDGSYAWNKTVIERQKETEINSFALVDLGKTDSLLAAMNAFFENVIPSVSEANFTAMSAHRRDVLAFGVGESGGRKGYDLVDLGDLVRHYSEYAPAKAEALLQAITDCVIYRKSALESCSGLTVYHPYANKDSIDTSMDVYRTLGFSSAYTKFVDQFVTELTGDANADWTNLDKCEPKVDKAMRSLFLLTLKDDQAAHYGDSSFEVLHRLEDGTLQFTYVSNDTSFDPEKKEITGEFTGTALYAVSADGEILSGELEYGITDRGIWQIPAVLTMKGTDGGEDVTHQALISCSLDPKTETLSPGGVQVWEEGLGGYTTAHGTSFADYQEITLTTVSRKETRDDKGILLPFEKWESSDPQAQTFAIGEDWSFALVHDTLNTDDLYVTFQVVDSRNNIYSSELRPITKHHDDDVIVTYDDEFLLIHAFALEANQGRLLMSMSLSNRTEKEAFIQLRGLTVNKIVLDATGEAVGSGENWGILPNEEEAQLMTLDLDPAKLEGLDAVTEINFDLVLVDAASEEDLQTVPVAVTLNRDISSLR